jgi:hypothetical protein
LLASNKQRGLVSADFGDQRLGVEGSADSGVVVKVDVTVRGRRMASRHGSAGRESREVLYRGQMSSRFVQISVNHSSSGYVRNPVVHASISLEGNAEPDGSGPVKPSVGPYFKQVHERSTQLELAIRALQVLPVAGQRSPTVGSRPGCGSGRFPSTYSVRLGRKVKNHLIVVVLAGVGMVLGVTANAQTASSQANDPHVIKDQDLELFRKDIRSQKKQLVAANLKLTDAEATKFWPVYDRYTADLIKINDKKYGLIQEYADHWGTMTDEQASSFVRQWLDVDIAIAQLRQKYVPEVAQVLNGRKTATFFQLDRRISMMIDLQLSSNVPIVQAQE